MNGDTPLAAWAAPLLHELEPRLLASVDAARPPRLKEACRYALSTGGKRMRPLLAFAAAEAIAGDPRAAMHAAIAVELVHTYSLVHDDLPCMDDDVERRGQPTVHVKYDVATAVLVGDALLAQAFAELDDARLVSVLARASGAQGMVAGQALDLAGIDGQGPDALLRLRELHRAKTGALIVAAATMGAISAGATREQLAHVQACADAVGLAFQVRDDLLDAPGDAANARPSYVTLLGPVGAGAEAERLAGLALAAAGTLPNPSALEMLARFAVQREH